MADLSLSALLAAMRTPQETIQADERAYAARIDAIADRIVQSGTVRLVLLAGPSGSGKTTSANMLADALRRLGGTSMVISLDDFYRDGSDAAYPRTPDGERDYESVDALDLPTLTATLSDIAAGRAFAVPHYDFRTASRDSVRRYEITPGACVIIEGLHALNPRVFGALPPERMLRIFISVSTNICDGETRILSGKKVRFLRRLVRDNLYRGASAERTLSMWQGVLDGEMKYLYPFRDLADLTFDTFHTFELSALKPYAERLLTPTVTHDSELAAAASAALARLPAVSASLIPDTSLIREFIPGGVYENLY